MERYLADEPVDAEMMRRALRRGTISLALVPVLCGSAFKNKGIQPLLDAVVEYLPSPLDIPPVNAVTPKGEVVERPSADEAPLAALAFKLVSDPYVGHLTFIRVYSGKLPSGSAVLNSSKGIKERIGRLAEDARQQAGRDRGGLCRRHRRRGGPEEYHHRRHPGG